MERYFTYKDKISRPIVSSFDNCFCYGDDLYRESNKSKKIRY